ncbi:citrate lyase acyl carrier protein [Limisalsivibrio acetivorans]|uniref:citrate lyase acyl carrier protein n=1 Tax=Limisalsivibrio acetivorans TaxID=1304888 RepID=UPI0003B4FD2B|nr:citrate lyase acyl carrier protein [Limisalsivibrio acetivorans]
MRIKSPAQAGTMQSSDLMVFVEPSDSLEIEVESTVAKQFEHLIRAAVEEELAANDVSEGYIRIADRGALDYAIKARLSSAVQRAGLED